jgi:hypothetical protein
VVVSCFGHEQGSAIGGAPLFGMQVRKCADRDVPSANAGQHTPGARVHQRIRLRPAFHQTLKHVLQSSVQKDKT